MSLRAEKATAWIAITRRTREAADIDRGASKRADGSFRCRPEEWLDRAEDFQSFRSRGARLMGDHRFAPAAVAPAGGAMTAVGMERPPHRCDRVRRDLAVPTATLAPVVGSGGSSALIPRRASRALRRLPRKARRAHIRQAIAFVSPAASSWRAQSRRRSGRRRLPYGQADGPMRSWPDGQEGPTAPGRIQDGDRAEGGSDRPAHLHVVR